MEPEKAVAVPVPDTFWSLSVAVKADDVAPKKPLGERLGEVMYTFEMILKHNCRFKKGHSRNLVAYSKKVKPPAPAHLFVNRTGWMLEFFQLRKLSRLYKPVLFLLAT
jgi:hypothetical protein